MPQMSTEEQQEFLDEWHRAVAKTRNFMLEPPVRVQGNDQYPIDDVVPRSYLVGMGVYHITKSIREWLNKNRRRRTIPRSVVEAWLKDLDLTIPSELDNLTNPLPRDKDKIPF